MSCDAKYNLCIPYSPIFIVLPYQAVQSSARLHVKSLLQKDKRRQEERRNYLDSL